MQKDKDKRIFHQVRCLESGKEFTFDDRAWNHKVEKNLTTGYKYLGVMEQAENGRIVQAGASTYYVPSVVHAPVSTCSTCGG